MARLASPQKSPRKNTPDTQDTLCAALSEVSLNKVSTKVAPKLKTSSSSPRKPTSTNTAEGHAKDQSSSARRQRVFRLEHVDSLTLPSLNGTSSKSHEQNLLSVTPDGDRSERSPVRATPRRVVKQAVNYAVPGLQAELSDSDWSGREQSEDEEDSEEDLERSRLLWRSPSKAVIGQVLKPMGIVDLTSPAKPATRKPAEPTQPQPLRRRSSTLDSLGDNLAILSFSPPRSRSPHKLKPAPPARPVTPSPPPSPVKSRLNSPSKTTRIRIPPTPHNPDVDAFWSQEVVNAWTDEYSPKKLLAYPRKQYSIPPTSELEQPPASPTKSRSGSPRKSPTKRSLEARAATAAKKAFEASREATASAFLAELDARITDGAIARLTESTGGVKIVWSNKLNTTAGRATWKCETIRPKPTSTSTSSINPAPTASATPTSTPTHHHHATIELATKVITTPTRLLNVLAHEFCHLANFMVSNIRDQPHGASFKRWAAIASRLFGERDVKVTTKHAYEIEYRFGWVCVGGGRGGGRAGGGGGEQGGCGMEYQRHSKSIDPSKHTCGVCKGRLLQIRPVPRGVASTPLTSSTLTTVTPATSSTTQSTNSPAQTPRQEAAAPAQSAYQRFVKEQFAHVRRELGRAASMSEVMREVGVRYRASKAKDIGKTEGVGRAASPERQKGRQEESQIGHAGQIEVIELSDSDEDDDVVEVVKPEQKQNTRREVLSPGAGDVDIDVDVTVADEDDADEDELDEVYEGFVDVDEVDDMDEFDELQMGRLTIADD